MKTRTRRSAGARLLGRNGAPYGEAVYQAIRRAIIDGSLAPGEHLREQEVSERYRVSRTPVREALKRLETEGLVEISGGRGVVVSRSTPDEIVELYDLREVLEGAAARLAAERASDADIVRLDLLVKSMERAASERTATEPGPSERIVQLTRDFHAAVARAARNHRLTKTLGDLTDAIRRSGMTTLVHPGELERSLADHRNLVNALRHRDGDTAETIAREHMRRTRDIRIAMSVSGWSDPVRSP